MSELLSREETSGSSGAYDSYDYDSQGSRQGQASTKPTGPTVYHGYEKDANGSITAIEGENGAVADDDRYVYDPYGELEDDPTNTEGPEEELGDTAEDNPFRFQGPYYDSGVESYDMQAREYRPDVGRFLSQDRFASAAGDLALQSDPLTQNRYAFAAGNPVSSVEWDGHCFGRKGGRISRYCRRKSFKLTANDFEARQFRRDVRESQHGRLLTTLFLDPKQSRAVGGEPISRIPLALNPHRSHLDGKGDSGPISRRAPAAYVEPSSENGVRVHGYAAAEAPPDIESKVEGFRTLFELRYGVLKPGETALGGTVAGYPTAVEFMNHYLDGSGKPKAIEVDQVESWDAEFRTVTVTLSIISGETSATEFHLGGAALPLARAMSCSGTIGIDFAGAP